MTSVEYSPGHFRGLEGSERVGRVWLPPQLSFCTTTMLPRNHKSCRMLPEMLHCFYIEMAEASQRLEYSCGGDGNFGIICYSDTYTMNMGRSAYDTTGVPKLKLPSTRNSPESSLVSLSSDPFRMHLEGGRVPQKSVIALLLYILIGYMCDRNTRLEKESLIAATGIPTGIN